MVMSEELYVTAYAVIKRQLTYATITSITVEAWYALMAAGQRRPR
jgi:hypothetical protein